MSLTIKHVSAEFVAQTWSLIEKYIEAAMPYGNGDYTLDQIKLLVSMGNWLLLVATDENNEIHGAATVSFINYPNSRVAFITTTGGKFIANKEMFKQMTDILKSTGATKIQATVRPSVARLLSPCGLKPQSILVEANI